MVFALKTEHNDRYLRFRNEEIQTYGLLQASGEKVTDSYAQFEFLNSSTHFGLFHIRCRYNNKYFVRWSPNHYWITATADKPNDNKKDWMCTLFKRIDLNDGSTQKLRLLHVELGHYACLWRIGPPFDLCLFAGAKNTDRDSMDVFIYLNLNKLHTITCSKRVAFKGDNGKYLGVYTKDGLPYLQFSYDNPTDPEAIHEIFTSPHGISHIKSNYSSKFWRSGADSWILADLDGDPRGDRNASAMFRTTPLNINVVAFLNMASTLHIKRYTHNGFEDCLNARTGNVDEFAVLEVIELGREDSTTV